MRKNRNVHPIQAAPPSPAPVQAAEPPKPYSVAEAVETPEAQSPSPFWKIVGGLAFGLGLAVVVAVYHHVQGQLEGLKQQASAVGKDLRGDLSRLSQNHVSLVKKDEVTTRLRNVWDRLKELQAGRTDLTSLRERCSLLAELYKAGEQERKELGEQVRKLREKGRATEEKAELAKQVRTLRERIAQLESKPAGSAPPGGAEEADKP